MKRGPISRGMRIALILIFALAILVFLPMRVALGLSGLDRIGLAAREVRGTIWSGRVDQLMLGNMPMGSVHAALSPAALAIGRARFDIWRRAGRPDDVSGALTVGFGRIGVDDVTGAVPLGRTFSPLPVGSLTMDDVSGYFAGDRCAHAEGQVRAQLGVQLPGLNLSQGLSGTAACDGDALLLPLVSQSGMEKIHLRVWRTGRYVAEMRVETADAALVQALSGSGFTQAGNILVLKVEGSL